MDYKAKINGVDITYKNHTVLEILKQYIDKNNTINYAKLKEIFPDSLQGSLGVVKNESDLKEWEKSKEGKKDTREKRFFVNDILSLGSEKIYVCTEWGDSNKEGVKPNFMPFIEYAGDELGFKIEDNSHELGLDKKSTKIVESQNDKNQPLNQILYGPPGTGKTYNTIDKALQIIDGEVPESREEAKKRFETLKETGQIAFVTFHQSYGYEEFVEGIKAKTTDRGIEYNIEAGVFKDLCMKSMQTNAIDKDTIKFNDYIQEGDKFNTLTGIEFE